MGGRIRCWRAQPSPCGRLQRHSTASRGVQFAPASAIVRRGSGVPLRRWHVRRRAGERPVGCTSEHTAWQERTSPVSYSTSIIAARATREQLRDAVLAAWPELQSVEEAPELQTLEEFLDWSSTRRTWAHDTMAFYQDGPWGVLLDLSMAKCADDTNLSALSRSMGRLFVATTQGTAGFAEIIVLDSGKDGTRSPRFLYGYEGSAITSERSTSHAGSRRPTTRCRQERAAE